MSTTLPEKEGMQELGLGPLRSEGGGVFSPLARLRALAGLERADVWVVVTYAVAIGLVSLAVPIAAQSLVNTVALTAQQQPVVVLATLVLVGLGAAGVLRVLQQKVVETLQQRLFVRAAHDAVARLVHADPRAFADHGAAEMVNRFFEVPTLQKAAAILLIDGLSVALQGTVTLVLLAFYHPALLAFDAVLIALICLTIFGLARGSVSTAIKESKAKYATVAWLEEVATHLRTLKGPGGEAYAFQRVDELARDYVQARKKHFKVLLRQIVASYGLQAVGTASLLGLGGYLVIHGELSLGQLVAAELIVTEVLSSVAKFGKYLETFYDLTASVDKLGTFIDVPAERRSGAHSETRRGAASLELRRVGHTLEGGRQILEGLSFELQAGSRMALLGPEASGKSTLGELLYGLQMPTTGQILLDGADIRTLTLAALRQAVAVVGRAEVLDATVLENLRMGREELSSESLHEALSAVDLTEEIAELPEGALTRLGHGGSRLSTSQGQRLTIARSLLGRPRLLVLDQSLDRLDAAAARHLLARLQGAHPDTSLLVLTNREDIAEAVGATVRLGRVEVESGREVGR